MITVRAHTRKPRSKPAVYIAKHEALRADVARDWAQRAERPRTPPVVKDEPTVAYVSPGILTSLASSIRDIVGRVM